MNKRLGSNEGLAALPSVDRLPRQLCAPRLSTPGFHAFVRTLEGVEVTGSAARLRQHVATANPGDEKTWQQVRPPLHRAGFNGLTLPELAAAAKVGEAELKDFLFRKAKTGEVVKVSAARFYLRATLAGFGAIAVETSRAVPAGRFTAAQVRDRTDIGRMRVIEILECFDRIGITRRAGDLRTIAKKIHHFFRQALGKSCLDVSMSLSSAAELPA